MNFLIERVGSPQATDRDAAALRQASRLAQESKVGWYRVAKRPY